MGSIPMLSDAQWRKISPLLPETKRDPVPIAAILYLEHSGQSLRHTAEIFRLSRSRLNEWHRALNADGSLAQIMTVLKLEAAGPLARRRGGGPEWYARPGRRRRRLRSPKSGCEVLALHCVPAAGSDKPLLIPTPTGRPCLIVALFDNPMKRCLLLREERTRAGRPLTSGDDPGRVETFFVPQ